MPIAAKAMKSKPNLASSEMPQPSTFPVPAKRGANRPLLQLLEVKAGGSEVQDSSWVQ